MATLLSDGRVLVTGGQVLLSRKKRQYGQLHKGATRATELYDPAADRWAPGPPLIAARNGHLAASLDNGRVLVIGGGGPPSAELFDPAADRWEAVTCPSGLGFEGLYPLQDGRLLALGLRFLPRVDRATSSAVRPTTPSPAIAADDAPVAAPATDVMEAESTGRAPKEAPDWSWIWTDEPPFPYPAGAAPAARSSENSAAAAADR